MPISYKIITQVSSNLLKFVLPSVNSENQPAFVANRQILDAYSIANGLIGPSPIKAGFSNWILRRLLILLIESFWMLFFRLWVLVFYGDLGSKFLSLVLIILSLSMANRKGISSLSGTFHKVILSRLSCLFWLLIALIVSWLTMLV